MSLISLIKRKDMLYYRHSLLCLFYNHLGIRIPLSHVF